MSSVRTFAGIFMALALWCGTAVAQNDVEFDASVESLEAVGHVNVSDVPAPSSDSSEDSSSSAPESSSEDVGNSEGNSSEAPPPPLPACKEVFIDKINEQGQTVKEKLCEPGYCGKFGEWEGKKQCNKKIKETGESECVCEWIPEKLSCEKRFEILKTCSGACLANGEAGVCLGKNATCECTAINTLLCADKIKFGAECKGKCRTSDGKDGDCSGDRIRCECKPDINALSCADKIRFGAKCEGKCRTFDGKDGRCDGDSQSCVCKRGFWNGVGDRIINEGGREGKRLIPFGGGRFLGSELPSDSASGQSDGFDEELPGEEEEAIDPGDDSPNEPGDDSPIDPAAE